MNQTLSIQFRVGGCSEGHMCIYKKRWKIKNIRKNANRWGVIITTREYFGEQLLIPWWTHQGNTHPNIANQLSVMNLWKMIPGKCSKPSGQCIGNFFYLIVNGGKKGHSWQCKSLYSNTPVFLLDYSPVTVNYIPLSTVIAGPTTITFRFIGLKRKTPTYEVQNYFCQFGQVVDIDFQFDRKGQRLPYFFVTTSSPSAIAWLSRTSLHVVGSSKHIECKGKKGWEWWLCCSLVTTWCIFRKLPISVHLKHHSPVKVFCNGLASCLLQAWRFMRWWDVR